MAIQHSRLDRLAEMVRDGEAELEVKQLAPGKVARIDIGGESDDPYEMDIDEYRMRRALSVSYGDLLAILHEIEEQGEDLGGMMYWHFGSALDELRPDDVFEWDRFVLFAEPFIDLSADEWQTCLQFYREYDQGEAERVVDEDTEIGDVVVHLDE